MATAPELLAIPTLDPLERGGRLRRLRRLAGVSGEKVALSLGYAPGGASSISKIENGERGLDDFPARKAANFLAAQGDLTHNAAILYGYLVGEHDSLTECIVDARVESATGRASKGRWLSVVADSTSLESAIAV